MNLSPRYTIIGPNGKAVEHHTTPRAAFRAMCILAAHDAKHGHPANYRIEPPAGPFSLEGLNLSDWALEVLNDGARCPDCVKGGVKP